MPEPNEPPEEEVTKKVVYEHVSTSRANATAIIILVVIALLLVGYILMHMHH